jgi:hypothetical protein
LVDTRWSCANHYTTISTSLMQHYFKRIYSSCSTPQPPAAAPLLIPALRSLQRRSISSGLHTSDITQTIQCQLYQPRERFPSPSPRYPSFIFESVWDSTLRTPTLLNPPPPNTNRPVYSTPRPSNSRSLFPNTLPHTASASPTTSSNPSSKLYAQHSATPVYAGPVTAIGKPP